MTDDKATDLTDAREQQNAEQAPLQASPAAALSVQENSAPLPASAEVRSKRTIQTDIARLLKDVKLPERQEFKAAADPSAATPKPEPQEPVAHILEERVIQAQKTAPNPPAPAASAPVQNPQISVPAPAPAPIVNQPVSDAPAHAVLEPASSTVVPVRTLKDDLQSIVREKKISVIRAVSLEQEKKRGQEHLVPEEQAIKAAQSRRIFGILFASATLILLGIAALLGVVYVMQKQTPPPAQTTTNTSILFAEQTEALPLDTATPQDLKNEFTSFTSKPPGPLGSITRIVPTLKTTSGETASIRPATLAEFFSALDIHPPQGLLDALGPDFFFGVHVVDRNAPIFVIPVQSYDRAFAGMLAWEGTMDADFSSIFPTVPMTMQNGTSTVPIARTFQDIVLRNYDARALEDDSNTIQLYYSFPTPKILVIATSPYSFPEILNRLQAQRKL